MPQLLTATAGDELVECDSLLIRFQTRELLDHCLQPAWELRHVDTGHVISVHCHAGQYLEY